MLALLLKIAIAIGTDPITLTVVVLESTACAILMRGMLPERLSIIACTPILFLGGLLAALLGLHYNFIEMPDIHMGEDGDWTCDWSIAAKALPNIFVSSTVGICASATLFIALLHRLQRHFG
ncbi:MAG: hypothetical protein JSS20_17310 [Proteobacteria bacterium]|nr:hypothetical protein [Pseudomonadota bacterium]